jgi:hypothetical protein
MNREVIKMKRITLVCDRCGKEYKPWDKNLELYGVAEIIHDDYEPQMDSKMDICWDCYHSFEKWWNIIGDYGYEKAFEIACDLMNGACIYGIDKDILFERLMKRDGVVGSRSYEKFILVNLDRFSDNDEVREKAFERLGW